jgi:hypothetical protein
MIFEGYVYEGQEGVIEEREVFDEEVDSVIWCERGIEGIVFEDDVSIADGGDIGGAEVRIEFESFTLFYEG